MLLTASPTRRRRRCSAASATAAGSTSTHTALAERLPAHHIVLTWARDGTAHLMDVYAIPRAACGGGVAAGLATVAQAVASAMAAGVLHDAPIASFSNVIESVDAEKKDAAADEAAAAGALAEARVLWETEEPTGARPPSLRLRAQSSASRPPPRFQRRLQPARRYPLRGDAGGGDRPR